MIQAIGHHVFVQKDPIHHLQVGGILIPSMSERTPRFSPTILGTVVSAGKRCRHVKAGDRVALKNVAGDDWLWNGQYFTHLREKDIIGICFYDYPNDSKNASTKTGLFQRTTHRSAHAGSGRGPKATGGTVTAALPIPPEK